jgi:serine/threonine-protein kinase
MLLMQTRIRTLAGRYQLNEVIGRGGMSTVYRATDLMLGRTIAVKVLLAALAEEDPTYVARFEREARAAAALAHRAVVTVYDAGVDDGERYIAMEYVDGRTLAEILRGGGPLEPHEAVRIARDVAGALAAAHAAGILHRDIKPSNVMVTGDGSPDGAERAIGAAGAVKVLDFGVARPLNGTTLTQAASIVGTAAYMAPERALGEPGDARSDVYSLGCLLYAMLTGLPPFTGEHSAVIMHQQINAEPRPPGQLVPGPTAALDAVVLGMLAKDPAARPGTAAEVRDRLAALAPGGTGSTLPLSAAAATTSPPFRTGATRVMGGSRSTVPARRAALAAVLTAAIALAAIALFDGGSQNVSTTKHHTSSRPATASTPAPTTSTPAATPATPPSTGPAAPPRPAGGPGHKKKDKKHDHGDGGD